MTGRPVSVKVDQDAASRRLYASRMASRIASCAPTSPFAGRSNAKLRRSPLTEYCRAGNVTLRPPARRSQMAKPTSFMPVNGPASASKITSASASLPAGVLDVLGRIRTDINSVFCVDIGPPDGAGRGSVIDGGAEFAALRLANEGGTHGPVGAYVVTG